MRALRFSPLSVLASAFVLFAIPAMAQNGAPVSRIVSAIDESQLVTLKGTIHPLANAKNDRGALPDSTQLDRIHLVLKRSAGQESALEQLIGQMHTPGNPNYHKWLTPDQFGKQFGPSDQDIAAVETWLTGHGFSVTGVKPGKQTLEFSGTVGQFRSAFHAQIHKYEVNGQIHTANANDPQIPAALASVVSGFVSLNNFRFKSYNEYLGKANYDPKHDRATPLWTIGPGGSPYADSLNFVLAPQDFYVQYDLNPLYTAATPINGAGQNIAIVNDSNVNIDLVNQFRTLFGLPANPPQVIVDGNDPGVDGNNNPDGANGDSSEAYIDVEWSGAVAPAATINLVVAGDTQLEQGLTLAMEHAVYGNVAPVMSLSFGACEQEIGSSNLFFNALWQQAAAQGITVLVSTGDSGSAVCDRGTEYAESGQAVSGFASTPYNVGVGGTDFYYSDWAAAQTNPSAVDSQLASYWNVTPSDHTPSVSIKGVIPEQPWNDSQFGDNILSYYGQSGGSTSIAGGSGGASNAAICAGNNYGSNGLCAGTASGYPKPTWQVGTGVPSDGVRDLPDVSLFAANGQNDTYYPVCATDGDCQPVTSGYTQISGYGGTSVSSPAFAGMMALVNQKYGRQGQADFVLYPLAKQYPASFHDVVNGSNTVPCAYSPTLSPNCIAAPAGLNYTVDDQYFGSNTEGQIGTGSTPEYNAGVGYDLASGLGTVDANQMVTNWGNVKFDATTTTLTPGQTTFTHGTSINITGSVSGTGTPTGSVALMTNSTEAVQQGQGLGVMLSSESALSTFALNGSGAFSGTTTTLPGGTYDIWGSYAGDGKNALSTSTPVQITVNPESSGIAFSILSPEGGVLESVTSGTGNLPYGTQLILDAKVLPSSEVSCTTSCPITTPPTGAVTFTDGSTPVNSAVINAEGDAEFNPGFGVGTHSVTATYSGDGSYNASASSPISFTVVQDVPDIEIDTAVTDSSGDLVNGPGQPTVLTVQVENSYQYDNNVVVPVAAPSGTVTLTSTLSGFTGTATLSPAVDPTTLAVQGVATYVVPAGSVSGNYNLSITYNGDANYTTATSTGTIPIVNTNGDGALNSSITAAMTGSVSPTTSVVVTGTVTGTSGHPAPTGGVYVYSSGNYPTAVGISPASSGDTSSFSIVLNSQSLFKGSNQITLEYLGDGNYNPSAVVLANTLTNSLSDFSMTANTTIVPVTAGATGTTTVNVASVNGFSGAVALTCSSTGGVTCTAGTPSVSLTSGGSGTSKITISAPTATTPGNYNVLINGTDPTGKYVHTLGVRAQVGSSSPGFALTNSGNVTVTAGATTGNTSTITVTPSNGFTGGVNLTCALTNPPAGNVDPTCFVASPVTISGTTAATSTLTITTVSTTTLGSYTVTVTGTDAATGKITSSTPVSVTVKAPPSFALTNSGAITFQAGATTGNTATVTVTPAGGYTGTVAFNCVLTPVAASSPGTCTIAPATVTGTSAVNATLTITTTTSTTVGSYTATVTGTDSVNSSLTSSTGVGVTVTAPPTPAITLSNSGALSFVAGATTGDTATITVTPSNAFTGNVNLTCAVTTTPASPVSPATCGVTSSVDVTGTSAVTGTLTVSTTVTTTPGAYQVTVTGKDAATGKITSTTLVSVTVIAPPSFALTNSGNITFQAGATTGNTAPITITPAGGFTGSVNLTCAITPAAATSPETCAVTTPVNITGTTPGMPTLTITTTLTTTPGAYTATVTGVDAATGKITSSTSLTVTVQAPPPPAIALSSSGALSFVAGATTGDTATITVTPSYGFTGNVNLTCAVTTTPTSPTSPATCGVSSTVDVTGTGAVTGTLTVTTTATTTPGGYVVTVTGKDASTGKVTSNTTVNVTVNPPPSIALTNSGAISFQAGATTGNTATITITPAGGFTGNVNLTCAISPTAASSPGTCTVTTPVNITGTTAGTSTLTITTAYATTTGSYTATVTGKDAATGNITSSTPVTVTVTAPPPPAIALTNNGALSFIAGSTTGDTATVTVTPSYGFTGIVNLSCVVTSTVTPVSPPSCTVGPAVTITGTGAQTSTVTVITTAATTPGSYTATVSGADAATGKVTGSTAVSVTVLGVPGFALTNNGPITFGAGLSAGNTATITVASVNSFTSSVALACAVTSTPSSPTSPATCSVASPVAGGSGTATLTITTTGTTTPGSYSVTVTGTAGAITEMTVVVANVNASYGASAGTVSPASVAPGGTATSTITVTSGDDYAGTVTLSCALTSSPSGATELPTCAGPTSPITLSSTATSGTGTVTVSTSAATTSELVRPKIGPGKEWLGAGGGAILAVFLFFGIPARRRSWRTMLGALVLMVIMGAMAGCGGSGGNHGTSGTTAGTYTFTVTATGSPAQGSGNTTTFSVDVN
jgi:hypothetical protein